MAEINPDRYQMDRVFALVVVNEIYQDDSHLPKRPGAEKDKERILEFCHSLSDCTINGIDEPTDNLTACEMRRLFDEISKQDFKNYDAFICFISAHGTKEGICGTDGRIVSVDEITSLFKELKSLVGKPKLFFIHHCRGLNIDDGVEADVADGPATSGMSFFLPIEADILVAHSSADGYASYRDVEEGSWFIIALMQALQDDARDKNLNEILVKVNRMVARKETKEGRRRQMPCYTSTLRKLVYFNLSVSPAL